jgi:putative nucleotidyltransferase with HDIG domain
MVALVATLLPYFLGPTLPYRQGEICANDLRVRTYFSLVNEAQTARAREAAVERLPAEAREDPVACENARLNEPPVIDRYPPGTPLVLRGQQISEQQMTLLEEEQRAYLAGLSPAEHGRRGLALFLIMGLLCTVAVLYVARFQPALALSLPRVLRICGLVVITLALGMLLSRPPWSAAVVPLMVMTLIVTIAYNPQFSLLMSFSMSLALTVALGVDLNFTIVQMSGMSAAILLLHNVRTRTRLVEVGAGAGAALFVATLATGLLAGQTPQTIALDACRNFIWGTLAGFLVSGTLPLIERWGGIVTDISLLDLADGSHPLLQELIRRAPGTYTHSMTVATLAEAAAESIEANPLLTRVGACFHDVGKMLKAAYFVENQSGPSRHENLEPALSTLIIVSHVKDGVALAQQYGLPRPIVDFIEQHHGTTLVEYFYREALRVHESEGGDDEPSEPAFRYPGPKPRNREIGILMLADAVESSSRTLDEPTASSLGRLVHDLMMKRLLDGQFEESGLTLSELHRIEESLTKSLSALYHARIKYPEADEEARELAG